MYKSFQNQKYLNLVTFRKNGVGVKTPVWFVQDGNALFVKTAADSGKVKRIRNNCQVNIAPCKMDGRLISEWLQAIARVATDPDIDLKVDLLLDKKYGLLKKLFFGSIGSNSRKYTILEMKMGE